jgi:hypothetical protein
MTGMIGSDPESVESVQTVSCFSVRKIPDPETASSLHSCKQYASQNTKAINAAEGSWIEVERKRWHGGREWCQMWCRLGLKDQNGTRLMLFDTRNSQRARYIVQISNDSQNPEHEHKERDKYASSELENLQLLTLPCHRAAGSDCDRSDKVIYTRFNFQTLLTR